MPELTAPIAQARPGHARFLIPGALASLLFVGIRWPVLFLTAAIIACGIGILWTANYTRTHQKWLILVLLLNEALASVHFIDDSLRPVLRYSMLALFCIPQVPIAIRSGLLTGGGFRLYLGYFVWGFVSVLYSLYPFYSLGRVSSATLLFTAVVAVISKLRTEEDIKEQLQIFWIASAVILGVLTLSLALPRDMTWKLDDLGMLRFTGVFSGPNQIGEIMLSSVASGVICWPIVSRRARILVGISMIMALAFDGMADSRSAFIALCVGLLALSISRYRLRALVIGGVLLLTAAAVIPRFETAQQYVGRGDVASLTGRTEIWKYLVQEIKQRPILGWGFEVEGQVFQNRDFPLREDVWNEGPRSSLHNGYFSRAIGVGVPAALIWVYFMVRALYFAIFQSGSDTLRRAALIGGLPVMVLNFAESTAGDCRYTVGLLLAVIWALSERSRTMRSIPEKPARAAQRVLLQN